MNVHKENEGLLLKMIEKRGKRWLVSKLAEECCELAAAALQHLNKDADFSAVLVESAHVLIHLEAIKRFDVDGNIPYYEAAKYTQIMNHLFEDMDDDAADDNKKE